MGMFLDYERPARREWKFTYKGSELLAAAKIKQREFEVKLQDAQARLRAAVATSGRLHKDTDVRRIEEEVESVGPKAEECAVFVHEFERSPDREFNLSVSDVTFFDLHQHVLKPEQPKKNRRVTMGLGKLTVGLGKRRK